MALSSLKIKTTVFLGDPLRFSIISFSYIFIFSPVIFTSVFWVLSLLIPFFHVTNFPYHDCFFCYFLFGTSFFCCCTASATDFRELFLLSGVYYLTLLPDIIKASLGASSSSLRAAGTLAEV